MTTTTLFSEAIDGCEQTEQLRIHALEELDLLDTPESEGFDRITRMASQLFGAPVAAVSFTDRTRQWFKSHVGTAGREIPRVGAPCAEVTRSGQILHIPDMLQNEQFSDCPLAQTGIRFYAGAPLTTRTGHTLGAMCVLDNKPRTLTDGQLRSLEDFAAMVMAQIELQHEGGRIEPSSGLPNRHQMYDDIEDATREHPGSARSLLLIELVDLSNISNAVSVLGASYLDEVNRTAARVMQAALHHRNSGFYHVGVASFALLLEDGEGWQSLVETLTPHLAMLIPSNGVPINLEPVYGVSDFRLGEITPQDILRTAVSAVTRARAAELPWAGYSPDHDKADSRRFHLLGSLREALPLGDQFHLVYQPRLDLRSGCCLSAEALLRWSHPTLGSVSPGEFIPLVEQTSLTRSMTQWVLNEALRQSRAWRDSGLVVSLSVNISARNLEEPDFAYLLAGALIRHNVHPSEIELEFTESALIRHHARVLTQLTEIRSMGLTLAIDDFGTGYSSFSYLHRLPATVIKIDQSFMRTLSGNLKEQTLVRSMISMAHDLGYRVVAEGVETAPVLDFLAGCDCDEIQGYFIARPLSAADCQAFLQNKLHTIKRSDQTP